MQSLSVFEAIELKLQLSTAKSKRGVWNKVFEANSVPGRHCGLKSEVFVDLFLDGASVVFFAYFRRCVKHSREFFTRFCVQSPPKMKVNRRDVGKFFPSENTNCHINNGNRRSEIRKPLEPFQNFHLFLHLKINVLVQDPLLLGAIITCYRAINMKTPHSDFSGVRRYCFGDLLSPHCRYVVCRLGAASHSGQQNCSRQYCVRIFLLLHFVWFVAWSKALRYFHLTLLTKSV